MYVRVDDNTFTARQIAGHEAAHERIRRGEINVAEAKQRLLKRYSKEEIDAIIELYSSAYGDCGMDGEDVLVEIICDAMAGMNAFATEGTERVAGEVGLFLRNVRKAEVNGTQEKLEPVTMRSEPKQEQSMQKREQSTQKQERSEQGRKQKEDSAKEKPVGTFVFHYNSIAPVMSLFASDGKGKFTIYEDGTLAIRGDAMQAVNTLEGFRSQGMMELYDIYLDGQKWTQGKDMPTGYYRIESVTQKPTVKKTPGGSYAIDQKGAMRLVDIATKNTTGEGGVTYYSREIEYDPETAGIKDQIRNSASILNEMEPVANLSVPENLNNKRNAEEWAIDILRRTGYKVERKGDGVIYFEEKDIRKAMNYCDTKAEKAAMAAVPMVLKRGIIIGAHDNHKNREKSTITFAGPVVLNGIRGNMGVVVNRRGNHYYTHRIIMPDGSAFVFKNKNDATQEPYRGVTTKGSLASTTSAASTDKVTQPEKKVKQKYSREMQSMEELRRVNRALERKLETVQRQAAREIQNEKEAHGITRTPTANKDDVAAVARRLLRDYGSKSKQWFIREELQKIADAIIGNPEADFSELRDKARIVADNILQGASYDINWEQQETLKALKKELRGTYITVTDSMKAAISQSLPQHLRILRCPWRWSRCRISVLTGRALCSR